MRVIVAGLGGRGRGWVRELRGMPGVELVACVETDETVLRSSAATLGLDANRCFARLDEALERTPCEALVVATSMDQHVEPCRAAIARGIGLLVEKPFALDAREAATLVAEARAAGVPIVVGQNYRHIRAIRAVRRTLESGALGRPAKFGFRMYRGTLPPFPPIVTRIPDGIIWELTIHHLDALRYLFGEPERVLARIDSPRWESARPAAVFDVVLSYGDGLAGTLESFYDSRGHEFFESGREHYLRVAGEHGTLHMFHRWLVLCLRGKLPRIVRRGPRRETEEVKLLGQLRESLRTGREPECSGRDNLGTLALIQACLRSSAEGRWVDTKEILK